jgi:hypothetical protein
LFSTLSFAPKGVTAGVGGFAVDEGIGGGLLKRVEAEVAFVESLLRTELCCEYAEKWLFPAGAWPEDM